MLIAIDGPAGAGKSTVARAVAQRLGFTFLDSGAMYRCVALAGRRPVEMLDIQFEDGDRVILNGEDVTEAIRTPDIALEASKRATDPEIRVALVNKQRELIAEGDWVAEGRDIGTVVAPDAELKIYLTATPEERARRREIPLNELNERDERDMNREASPLKPAPDAVEVDTTGLDADAIVEKIVGMVR
ncbi:MAG TPA: (d)CMP kinase [Baekduia sp.]|nr:(d)CMP kinase [Baekduia sp.]